ncbi:VPLPA-CTERM-specific exosortase XrtD [Desulfobacca acetoxidans]|uniref:Eight transmembrane protein EpsH n=1 Tax=Desulfobacca acetoxidans (strain ATCC 700848 / DSM 11109 / ASRB2) TaxID=880072 RepID=F2NEE3_DESAR|nr:VPLPA-CTERM-specific exosortase XrtD [Desulfobacca acetoxidans]AEB08133.1 eight transmembrane protein EpsH [Desulfobacca acetoxidans DSM 11109]
MQNNKSSAVYPLSSLAILGAITIWFYWPILSRMFLYLFHNDDYSYGLLLPLVSAYLVYQKWPRIRGTSWRPSWWGLAIIVAGIGLSIIGELAADLYVPRVSFVVCLGGILLLVGGWRLLRLLIFPLLLLLLMIPLPELITNKLTLPLQLISSQLAAFFLHLIGIPVLRQGNIIDLGLRQMQIVDACSGLRYILALLALGVIYCYFYQRKPWKVLVLLIVLIPATIFANGLRVAGMGIFPALVEGFWHAFSGWLIFLFCFVMLAVVNYLLNRLSPPSVKQAPEEDKIQPPPKKSLPLWSYTAAAVGVILLCTPVAQRASHAPNYPLKKGFENFPMNIDTWQGHHAYIDPAMVALTKSHAHLYAEFSDPEGDLITLWIAYYETQKKAGGFVHSPKGCFTASGWRIAQAKVIEIAPGKPVNWMVTDRLGTKLLVYYWFMQRGRWLVDETLNKFFMAYDGLLRRRTDGSLIRLTIPIHGNTDQAQQRLTAFANSLIPILNQYIPD